MKFKIPFTGPDVEILKKKSKFLYPYVKNTNKTFLARNLHNVGVDISRKEYIAICARTFIYSFIILSLVSTTVLGYFSIPYYYFWGLVCSMVFSLFIFLSQIAYPGMYVQRRQRDIERNLVAGLEDMLVQLNSGIPLFSVLVNISDAGYGELSEEFKRAVRRISAGSPEQEVLEELSKRNPSNFFKRTLWQISNGMTAGSDMVFVVKDSIKALNEEQLIQIQNYGNKLNPLMVFYMLVAVIVPSLSITFMTILSSMINLPEIVSIFIFIGLFIMVMLIQVIFLGIIKSKRPSLL